MPKSRGQWIGPGAAFILVLLIGLAPWAASTPDGLEWVAEVHGFVTQAREYWHAAPMPGYTVPGLAHPAPATLAAGLVGTGLAIAGAAGLMRLQQRRKK